MRDMSDRFKHTPECRLFNEVLSTGLSNTISAASSFVTTVLSVDRIGDLETDLKFKLLLLPRQESLQHQKFRCRHEHIKRTDKMNILDALGSSQLIELNFHRTRSLHRQIQHACDFLHMQSYKEN